MLAVYGVWDEELGKPAEMTDCLLDSYLRRRRWEWEQQAVHIVNALALAMGGEDGKTKKQTGDPLRALARLGIQIPEATK